MNMIVCSERCRWQKDGLCTLSELSRGAGASKDCCYFAPDNNG